MFSEPSQYVPDSFPICMAVVLWERSWLGSVYETCSLINIKIVTDPPFLFTEHDDAMNINFDEIIDKCRHFAVNTTSNVLFHYGISPST